MVENNRSIGQQEPGGGHCETVPADSVRLEMG